jgi:tetratricopeptide (TPR) repeat protein
VNECPESVHLLQSWAMLEHKCGDLAKAGELFEQGMARDPGNPYIAHAWGQLARKRGDYDKARKLYMDSLRLYGPWAQVGSGACVCVYLVGLVVC